MNIFNTIKDIFKINKRRPFYMVKPFEQLEYDLIYAHNVLLFESSGIKVYSRIYKDITYIIKLVFDYDQYKKEDLSLKNLKFINYGKSFDYDYNLNEALDNQKFVYVTCFKENNDEIISYVKANAKFNRNTYDQYLIYNDLECLLEVYQKLPDYGNMFYAYNNLMYFDLAARDLDSD